MTPISTISERSQPLNLIEVIKPLAILVTQVAIRVIFISSVILITSALFPYAVQPILIPIVAVSSAFFSAFFFIRGKDLRPPLSKEVLSTIDLTKKLPKGLTNDRNNCWMNALIQTFVSDPSFLASIDKKQESSDPLTKALVRIVNSYKSASI